MDQVSRPLQILLVAVLLFGAVYMLALRPKTDGGGSSTSAKPAAQASTSPAQGPGSSIPGGLGKAVTKARGAAGQSDAANQRVQQATGGGGTSTSAAPAASASASSTARRNATPTGAPGRDGFGFPVNNAAASSVAVAAGMMAVSVVQAVGGRFGGVPSARVTVASDTARSAGRAAAPAARAATTPKATSSPAAVRAAMASGKVVVLLFWNQRASDDRRVRDELAHVSSHGGRALIVAAPIRQVSLFSASIRGIQVLQSPTILVVDHSRKARTLVGFTDRAEIGQSVDEALAGR